VFVGGRPLIWRREMMHLDEEAITARALAMMRKAKHLIPSHSWGEGG
jgi:hypothetical protein